MKVRAVKATLPQHDGAVVVFSRKIEYTGAYRIPSMDDMLYWDKGTWDAKKQLFVCSNNLTRLPSEIVEWHYITDRPPRQEKPKPDPLILEPSADTDVIIPEQIKIAEKMPPGR